MSLFYTLVSGVVEGLTEFLPVSSTAHLILVNQFFGESSDAFLVFIQVGAICAVITEYIDKLSMVRRTIIPILVSFFITAVVGFFVYPIVRGFLIESLVVIAGALIVGGIIMVCFDRQIMNGQRTSDDISLFDGIWIGLAQSFAIIPGVSRSYASIIGAGVRGLSRTAAVEYSFLLSVPTIVIAAIYDMYRQGVHMVFVQGYVMPLVGFVVSWVVALLCIRVFLRYVATHDFRIFGWYRIIVGVGVLVFLCI